MKRSGVIVVSAVVCVVASVVYFQTLSPAGVESMGDGGGSPSTSTVTSWIALATAITGLLTALTNLVLALRKPRA